MSTPALQSPQVTTDGQRAMVLSFALRNALKPQRPACCPLCVRQPQQHVAMAKPAAPAPGAWSSQRHWHAKEDEFIYVLSGEVVLVTDAGDEVLRAGDCAGFKGGDPDGHCLQNRGTAAAMVLEIGSRRRSDRLRGR